MSPDSNATCRFFIARAALVALALCACRQQPADDEGASPLAETRAFWNATYREKREFPPSQFLIEMVADRKPDWALDVGMGQSRNAIYLASRGWKVTGVDISDEGLRQAREAARARKLELETINADIDTWDHGIARWDLVALIYTGDDVDKIRKSLKPGGLVVSERFHVDANPNIGTTPAEFARLYGAGFEILRNEVVEEVSVWGGPKKRPEKVVRFAARKL